MSGRGEYGSLQPDVCEATPMVVEKKQRDRRREIVPFAYIAVFAGILLIALFTIRASSSSTELLMDSTDRSLMETTAKIPSAWVQGERADPAAEVVLHFALKHNVQRLEDKLLAVSTPGHPEYAQHLSVEEVDALAAPHEHVLLTVRRWLKRQGVGADRLVPDKSGSDFVTVRLSVGEAEKLLHAQYFVYTNAAGRDVIRTPKYSVPTSISTHLDFAAPTVQFPSLEAHVHRISELPATETPPWMMDSVGGASASYITPSELLSMYNINDAVGGAADGNLQVATGFLDEFFCDSDLAEFYDKFFTDTSDGAGISRTFGNTTDDDVGCGDEANLDVEYITATGRKVPTEFWSFSGYSPDVPQINEPFLDFMLHLNQQSTVPWVVSTSYGEDEASTSIEYARRVQSEFMKAGLRGISLLFASGDSGVASMFDESGCDHFSPQWPAASPWVTAVGATGGTDTEKAASFSSGGFSYRWPMPSYQKDTVMDYLLSEQDLVGSYVDSQYLPHDMYSSNGTSAGRAFPDIAAAGENFLIVQNGNVYTVDGTSASTPVFAGIVSLVNEQRILAGKKPLGFLNPLIYQYGSDIFTDITTGSNPGCSTSGFSAVSGWDPVTGFGTPNYGKFVKVALELA